MEGLQIVGQGKMQVSLVDPPVIVLAVDQVVSLIPVVVLCQVEEVADAVRLFAYVVAVACVSGKTKGRRGGACFGICLLFPP